MSETEYSAMKKLKNIFCRFRSYLKGQEQAEIIQQEEPGRKENPFLFQLRSILEQVLEQYELTYQEFRPVLIDTDVAPESMLDEDDVSIVLEQISGDLNYLHIFTERPAYFQEYIERMYEDSGLVVQVEGKKQAVLPDCNIILDMERNGAYPGKWICGMGRKMEKCCYIPVYKKEWRAENLDISVPIGYNTVIVKGRRSSVE